MPVEKINVESFLSLAVQHPVIDVRSPGEYRHAHLPGAYNLPLFTDEERATVGTAYKQKSREQAIKIGLDFFAPKMRKMIEEAEALLENPKDSPVINRETNPSHKTLLLYCWRGGMRSAAVAWLLDLYGYKIYTLAGGYKKFRNYVLDTFRLPFRLNILGGFTGSGKTEILKELVKYNEKIIDLEEIACHKGSAFGNIGLPPQPTQEMFENILALQLRNLSCRNQSVPEMGSPVNSLPSVPIWLEDESQRIGQLNIPNDLWNQMRRAPVFFLDIPFEERLRHITEEYGTLDKERMLDAIGRITNRLGGLEANRAIQYLKEGNLVESFRILLKYYDKWYQKGLHNRENLKTLLHTIPCPSVSPFNAKKLISQQVQYVHV